MILKVVSFYSILWKSGFKSFLFLPSNSLQQCLSSSSTVVFYTPGIDWCDAD